MEKLLKLFVSIGSVITMLGLANVSDANLQSTNCQLGQTCPLPADHGRWSYYEVWPHTGNNYTCLVTATSQNALEFTIYDGDKFRIINGRGLHYIANPTVFIAIKGKFADVNNPTSKGQIKFHTFTGHGKVTCESAK